MKIINSIIDLRNVSVNNIMVPLNRTFRLNEDDIIDQEMINNINKKNFSKIPIFSHD